MVQKHFDKRVIIQHYLLRKVYRHHICIIRLDIEKTREKQVRMQIMCA